MEIPGLGKCTEREYFKGSYDSTPIPIPVLGGIMREIGVSNYDQDSNKEEFHTAIANFLSIDESVLEEAEPHIFQYYRECKRDSDGDGDDEDRGLEDALEDNEDDEDEDGYAGEQSQSPSCVWPLIEFGNPSVQRRLSGDKGIYILLSCDCEWEEEHGLQIVFKNGLKVNMIGPSNGHLSNADAFPGGSDGDRREAEELIYSQR